MFELLKGGAQEPAAPAPAPSMDGGTAPPVVRFRGIHPGAPA
jgi:hypothetical protein